MTTKTYIVSEKRTLGIVAWARIADGALKGEAENERKQAGSKSAGWDVEALLTHDPDRETTKLGRDR
jgi:hypothetical protein